jgi:hypothetical protein
MMLFDKLSYIINNSMNFAPRVFESGKKSAEFICRSLQTKYNNSVALCNKSAKYVT